MFLCRLAVLCVAALLVDVSVAQLAENPAPEQPVPAQPEAPPMGPMGAPGGPGGDPGGDPGGGSTNYETETLARMAVKEELTPYGVDLLGERIDLSTGSLSFHHVDVSIPGNSGLEVAIRRSVRLTGDIRTKHMKAFLDWSLDLPSLSMKVAGIDLWKNNRCNGSSEPDEVFYMGQYYLASQFWNGLELNIPGQGSRKVFDYPKGPFPNPGHVTGIRKGTNDYWKIECLPTIQNGSGEGFLATSPDGVKYTFNRLAYEEASPLGPFDR